MDERAAAPQSIGAISATLPFDDGIDPIVCPGPKAKEGQSVMEKIVETDHAVLLRDEKGTYFVHLVVERDRTQQWAPHEGSAHTVKLDASDPMRMLVATGVIGMSLAELLRDHRFLRETTGPTR